MRLIWAVVNLSGLVPPSHLPSLCVLIKGTPNNKKCQLTNIQAILQPLYCLYKESQCCFGHSLYEQKKHPSQFTSQSKLWQNYHELQYSFRSKWVNK